MGELTVKQDSLQVRYAFQTGTEVRTGVEYFYGEFQNNLRRAEAFIESRPLLSWDIVRIRKTEEVLVSNK